MSAPEGRANQSAPREPEGRANQPAPREPEGRANQPAPREPEGRANQSAPREPEGRANQPAPRDGDRIELRGLVTLSICGALPEEQDRPQPLEVDLDVYLDLSEPGASDALVDTVDYGGLCAKVEGVLTGERFTLLERAATRVAETVLGHYPPVVAVTVAVRKLRPPVPHALATSGVRLTRTR